MIGEVAMLTWEFLVTPGVAPMLAGMMVVAVFIGGALAYNYSEIWRWLAAIMPLLFFMEGSRRMVLLAIGNLPTLRPLILTVTTLLLYLVGLVVGVTVVARVRRPYIAERKKIIDTAKATLSNSPKVRAADPAA